MSEMEIIPVRGSMSEPKGVVISIRLDENLFDMICHNISRMNFHNKARNTGYSITTDEYLKVALQQRALADAFTIKAFERDQPRKLD